MVAAGLEAPNNPLVAVPVEPKPVAPVLAPKPPNPVVAAVLGAVVVEVPKLKVVAGLFAVVAPKPPNPVVGCVAGFWPNPNDVVPVACWPNEGVL